MCGQAVFTSVWASSSHRSQNSAVDDGRARDDTQTVNTNHTLMNMLKSSDREHCSSNPTGLFLSGLLIIFSVVRMQNECVLLKHAMH